MASNESPPTAAFADGTVLLPPSPRRPRPVRTWSRRVFTVTLYTALFALIWALLPVLVLCGFIADRVRNKPVFVRASLFFAVYLALEMAGIWVSLVFWLGAGTWLGASRHRLLRWTFWLQCWWLRTIFAAASRLFGWRVHITGEDAVERGNMLLFIRHVSTADTALAGVFVSSRHNVFVRYVVKSELLWDPSVDIVGNRLPNGFVERDSGKTEDAIAEVTRLARDLGPMEGALIYPEGTRFTPAKRAKILAGLEERGDPDKLARASAFEHVLPPKMAGPQALLEHARDADVVFCVHTGFERAMGFQQFMAGALNDIELRIHFWRVASADIPTTAEERAAWLDAEWHKVDAWVAANIERPAPSEP